MNRFVGCLGWSLLASGAVLILLGIAAWPPGGLMFGLPFFFLIPGVPLAAIGGLLAWLSRRHSAKMHAAESKLPDGRGESAPE